MKHALRHALALAPVALRHRLDRRTLLVATAAAALARTAQARTQALAAPAAPVVPSAAAPAPLAGRIEHLTIASRLTGVDYPVRLYAPPGARRDERLPIVYLVDAEWRLETLARAAESKRLRLRLAGVANEATRNHDDLPTDACNAEGGGQVAFFEFLRSEFRSFVETRVAVDPAQRALWGHSYGGALVLYALFAAPAEPRAFAAYLVADPSTRCLGPLALDWEAAYAAANDRLPVRLHYAYANPANLAFAERIRGRGYRDLKLVARAYPGGHDGMIPAASADALDLAFATA